MKPVIWKGVGVLLASASVLNLHSHSKLSGRLSNPDHQIGTSPWCCLEIINTKTLHLLGVAGESAATMSTFVRITKTPAFLSAQTWGTFEIFRMKSLNVSWCNTHLLSTNYVPGTWTIIGGKIRIGSWVLLWTLKNIFFEQSTDSNYKPRYYLHSGCSEETFISFLTPSCDLCNRWVCWISDSEEPFW